MRFNDEFLLLRRSGSVPPRAGPDRWEHMRAEAELDCRAQMRAEAELDRRAQMRAEVELARRADRGRRRSRRRSRVRLTLARKLRGLAAALEGARADRIRQR